MAERNEIDIFEEQVADRDIKRYIDFIKDGFDKYIISDTTGDRKWKICTIVWKSGMIRYFEPRAASPNASKLNKPLTSFETVQLILSMQQLGSETGSISYKVRDTLLRCCSLLSVGIDKYQDLKHFILKRIGMLPVSEEVIFDFEDGLSTTEIEMYANMVRQRRVQDIRKLRRSDEDWEIYSAMLGSSLIRYLRRSAPSPDIPVLDQHLPILQVIQILLLIKQSDTDPRSMSYLVRALAIGFCSSITRKLERFEELQNRLLETVQPLWPIVVLPFEILRNIRSGLQYRFPIWH